MTMAAAYKGWRTRRVNQVKEQIWERFKAQSIKWTGFIPAILPAPNGGFDLMWDRGYGVRCRNFKTRGEALGFVLSLACST